MLCAFAKSDIVSENLLLQVLCLSAELVGFLVLFGSLLVPLEVPSWLAAWKPTFLVFFLDLDLEISLIF